MNTNPARPRRVACLALAVLAAAGACGTGEQAVAPAQAPTTATTLASAPPVPAARNSTNTKATPIELALVPYAAFGTDAAPGVFPRTIRHAMGETRIEKAPLRVVTLDTGELDTAIELGIKPVGTLDYGADGLPVYFDPADIAGVEVVGTILTPNLEAVARARPDIILSSKLRHEALYDKLSQIAPTVFAERPGVSWKQNFDLFAQALGREAQAAATKERYAVRVAELNARLPLPRPTVSVVRILSTGVVRLYQRANFMGVLLTDLGFPRPDAQNVDDFAADVGLESLPDAAGDVIVLAVFDATKNPHTDKVLSSPLWKALPAVQAGAVHTVDDQTWIGGIGYRAAFAVMDQLPGLIT